MIRGAFIGIDRHADLFIGDLTGAARDATALWAVLSDSIAHLDAPLLTDDAATLDAMRDVLDATLGAADEDDVVIVGFAGHGTQDHRLVLHDTNVADLPNTTLGMDELAQRFREGRVAEVVEIGWWRNLRVNQHPPNRRWQPPGRSRHEAEYRQLILFATARRRGV